MLPVSFSGQKFIRALFFKPVEVLQVSIFVDGLKEV